MEPLEESDAAANSLSSSTSHSTKKSSSTISQGRSASPESSGNCSPNSESDQLLSLHEVKPDEMGTVENSAKFPLPGTSSDEKSPLSSSVISLSQKRCERSIFKALSGGHIFNLDDRSLFEEKNVPSSRSSRSQSLPNVKPSCSSPANSTSDSVSMQISGSKNAKTPERRSSCESSQSSKSLDESEKSRSTSAEEKKGTSSSSSSKSELRARRSSSSPEEPGEGSSLSETLRALSLKKRQSSEETTETSSSSEVESEEEQEQPCTSSATLLDVSTPDFVKTLFRLFEPKSLVTLSFVCRRLQQLITEHRHRLRRSKAYTLDIEFRQNADSKSPTLTRLLFTNRRSKTAHFIVNFTSDLPQPRKFNKYLILADDYDDAVVYLKLKPGERCVHLKTPPETSLESAMRLVFKYITRTNRFDELLCTDVSDVHLRLLSALTLEAEMKIRELTLSESKRMPIVTQDAVLEFMRTAEVERFAADKHPPIEFTEDFFNDKVVKELESFELGVDIENVSRCEITDQIMEDWENLNRLVIPYVHTRITADGVLAWIMRKLDTGEELDRISLSITEAEWQRITTQLMTTWHKSKFRNDERFYFESANGYTMRLSRGLEIGGRLRFCADVS